MNARRRITKGLARRSSPGGTPSPLPQLASALRHRSGRRFAPASGGGLTLIELLLVVVIIGILAAIVVPRLVGRSDEARRSAAMADIKTIAGALSTYEVDNGKYPTTAQGLGALLAKPSGSPEPKNWKGPY